MKARPRTKGAKKRRIEVQARRRAGSRPVLGIPPKGKGWLGKKPVE